MKRRTVLQSLAALVAVRPLTRFGVLAAAPVELTEANLAALKALAEVVLPSSIGQKGRDAAVERFASWVANYKEGADTGGGYGTVTTLSRPTGPSPAAKYPALFDALDAASKVEGAAVFAALPIDKRRAVVEKMLNEPQRVTQMPARPNGANLVADFMGYYFASDDARDLGYNAAIGTHTCRGLAGSDKAPAPLTGGR